MRGWGAWLGCVAGMRGGCECLLAGHGLAKAAACRAMFFELCRRLMDLARNSLRAMAKHILCTNTTLYQHYFVPTLLCASIRFGAEATGVLALPGATATLCKHHLVQTPLAAKTTWCQSSFVPTSLGANTTLCQNYFVSTQPFCHHHFGPTPLDAGATLCRCCTVPALVPTQHNLDKHNLVPWENLVPMLLCTGTTLRQHYFATSLRSSVR